MKTTPWFKENEKPVRLGFYRVGFTDIGLENIFFKYWDGYKWGTLALKINNFTKKVGSGGMQTGFYWKGLTK